MPIGLWQAVRNRQPETDLCRVFQIAPATGSLNSSPFKAESCR